MRQAKLAGPEMLLNPGDRPADSCQPPAQFPARRQKAALPDAEKQEISTSKRTLHPIPAAGPTIAQKSYFVLNGATETSQDGAMKTMSAREAKNRFGLMIDTARAEPVLIEKHGRGVVVVVSVEEYERLSVQSGRVDKGRTVTSGAAKVGQ